jgi:SPP1 gp7 family putative phage head morphogenesis protein
MTQFFESQAPKIAAQVGKLRRKIGKAETTPDEQAAIDSILAQIDFLGWSILVDDTTSVIEEIAKDQALAALAQVGIDVEARPDVLNIVNSRALAYARARSAELVGMRYDGLGRLVPNPNAEWQIADSTRDFIRADVSQAIQEGWSNAKLAQALTDAYGFSDTRAETIARTETAMAANRGAIDGYKASGVVEGKIWLTAEDDLVSDECAANGEQGAIGLEEDFESGDDAPPAHPNCRCAIAPVVDFDKPDAAPAAETED